MTDFDVMSASNERRRLDEIIALESIFVDEEIKRSDEHGPLAGQFYAHVTVPEDFQIVSKHREPAHDYTLSVSYLPPIVLHYSLPERYPSDPNCPPSFTLTCHWLNRGQLTRLCKKLDSLWQENHVDEQGAEILFTWAHFLKNESLEFLTIQNSLDVSLIENLYRSKFIFTHVNTTNPAQEPNVNEAVNDDGLSKEIVKSPVTLPPKLIWTVKEPTAGNSSWSCFQTVTKTNVETTDSSQEKPVSSAAAKVTKSAITKAERMLDCRAVFDFSGDHSLKEYLEANDKSRKRLEFCRQVHECGICFESKFGTHFTRFHPCSHKFCSECTNAYFSTCINDGKVHITCPGEACNADANFNQIKDLVSTDLFLKYDKMLLMATLDELGDVITCPRPNCQYSVIRDGEDKLANCSYCGYAFCVDCRMGYHGIEPCRFKSEEEQRLIKEYENASAQKRVELENRYSKRRLEVLVQNSKTQLWIEDNSKPCPHCRASIQKSYGCNKMICWKCNTNFCWLCATKLDPKFPYLHFNKQGSKCFNLLFHGIDVNNEEFEDEEIEEEFNIDNLGLYDVEQFLDILDMI